MIENELRSYRVVLFGLSHGLPPQKLPGMSTHVNARLGSLLPSQAEALHLIVSETVQFAHTRPAELGANACQRPVSRIAIAEVTSALQLQPRRLAMLKLLNLGKLF